MGARVTGGLLRKLLGGSGARAGRQTDQTAGRPDPARILTLAQMPEAVYAVGDVHGCRTLYRELEARISADAAGLGLSGPALVVLLGDVIDRGPDSAGMVDDLLSDPPDGMQRLVLRGNHEEMMLRFLSDPEGARRWLDFGGIDTLASYGAHLDPEAGQAVSASRLRTMAQAAVPSEHAAFLQSLPYGLAVGPYFLCHAGIDPARALRDQDPRDLVWGPPERVDDAPPDPARPVIVHGHVIVPRVQITARRINVDTGAYQGGALSAVRLCPGKEPFLLSAGGFSV